MTKSSSNTKADVQHLLQISLALLELMPSGANVLYRKVGESNWQLMLKVDSLLDAYTAYALKFKDARKAGYEIAIDKILREHGEMPS